MKTFYCTTILLFFFQYYSYSQTNIEQIKEFYKNADFACYEKKIQQDIDAMDRWLTDSFHIINPTFISPMYKVANIDLKKEKKVFVLAVAFANTENYNYENNISDYLIIDSLRSFIAVCVDDKMNVKAITDIAEPGAYVTPTEYYYFDKNKRNKIKKIIKNINKEKPEIIMYCDNFKSSFLYLINNDIYIYHNNKEKSFELNQYISSKYININLIRNFNKINIPYTKSYIKSDQYNRLTGNTPEEELRICR